MLTETQVKVLLMLLDNDGHSGRDLANYLGRQESNLNPILKRLESMGIIFQGDARISRKQRKKEGNYKEFPYYLSNNLDGLRIMIREITLSDKVLDSGFVLDITKKSKYIKSMKEKFKRDVAKTISDELRRSYPPYADPRFQDIQQLLNKNGLTPPFLEADFERYCICGPSPLQSWYHDYLKMRHGRESDHD
jgi:hypothetical protein